MLRIWTHFICRQNSPICLASAKRRAGAAIVEAAIVLGTCLALLLGMLDLALAELRFNLLSEAARAIAREAVVHGDKAAPQRPTWGPVAMEITARAEHSVAALARDLLATMKPSDVVLRLEWPDGGNTYGQQVRVSLRYEHQWLSLLRVFREPAQLSAVSTMYIAH